MIMMNAGPQSLATRSLANRMIAEIVRTVLNYPAFCGLPTALRGNCPATIFRNPPLPFDFAKQFAGCRLLTTIPGVGPLVTTGIGGGSVSSRQQHRDQFRLPG